MAKTLKEQVMAKCELDDNGCLVWNGSMRNGSPTAFVEQPDGRFKGVNLQRFRMIKKLNLDDDVRIVVRTTCGNPRCINRDHLELVKRTFKHKRRRARGTISSQMFNNKTVFANSVTKGGESTTRLTGVTLGTVSRIRKNVAMHTYFQWKIETHCGVNHISVLRNLTDLELQSQFNLSKFAIDYIRSGEHYKIHDPDLFDRLLDECEVYGEHLVWVGASSETGTPMTKALGNQSRKALPVFVYAAYGLSPDAEYKTTCGFEGCVNPYHSEVQDNDDMATV